MTNFLSSLSLFEIFILGMFLGCISLLIFIPISLLVKQAQVKKKKPIIDKSLLGNKKFWTTTIRAIDPKSGELILYMGPDIPGYNYEDAQRYCYMNGMGYLKVEGVKIAEKYHFNNYELN